MASLVYGLGDPVLDIIARVEHGVLQRLGAEPGGCVPVSAEEMAALLALPEVQANALRVPGGSAANVAKGLASLAQGGGGTSPPLAVSFVGMVGADAAGAEYRASIAAHGVAPRLLESASGAATATCLCLVTPDGQRTMRTCLGAATELARPEQLPPALGGGGGAAAGPANDSGSNNSSSAAQRVALLHCEGYSLYRLPVAAAAMGAARAGGARVSLDLASLELVQRCWGALQALLAQRLLDVVFCNEQEAAALCQAAGLQLPPGAGGEQRVAAAQAYLLEQGVGTVVVSRGAKGCIAKSADGSTAVAAAANVPVVDTIGAGDFFTCGFLLGLLRGASLEACARCGCTAGTAAVRTAGAELGPATLQQLRADIAAILEADRAAGGKVAAAGAAGGTVALAAVASA